MALVPEAADIPASGAWISGLWYYWLWTHETEVWGGVAGPETSSSGGKPAHTQPYYNHPTLQPYSTSEQEDEWVILI